MNTQVVVADSYFESYDKLDKQSRKRVRDNINKLVEEDKSYGLQIHSLKRVRCDSSFRSARVNRDLRLILSQQGNKYILLYVDHHDDAYDWAENKFFEKNRFGAVYLYDQVELNEYQEKKMEPEDINELYDSRPSLLEKEEVRVKDLSRLDINEVHAQYLMEIKDEDEFLEFISFLPEEIQEGLIDIITGNKTITRVCMELEDQQADKSSLEEALEHKDSKRRFYTVEDFAELDYILEEDMERWKLFLHPQQESLIKRDYSGPALIEGGPGTGKTVVGIHRAVHLAQDIYPGPENRILFCTFSKKLAFYIWEKIEQLVEQKNIEDNIDVYGVDSLIYTLVKEHNLSDYKIDLQSIEDLFLELYEEFELEEDVHFYKTEYKEVIQRNNIRTLEEYLEVFRTGRGQSLQPATRRKVWEFFSEFIKRKEEEKLMDFEDQAYLLYEALVSERIEPQFDSIIIDEAQDLSPVKLKLLAKLVKRAENNLILLSDSNQRIYQLNSWKEDVGISIVGRTHYLTLNYRTTKQIRNYADSQFIHSQKEEEHLREYKSLLLGPEPIVKDFADSKEKYHYLVGKVEELLTAGIAAHEICIITASSSYFAKLEGILEFQGIDYTILKSDIYPHSETGIGISTLHGSKGLEFRTVILLNYSQIVKDLKKDLPDEWYTQNRLKQVECLKYVACTRAREELIIIK
ncbi:UvrD-helicase domain-containing protein [Fuchsiella alkaliacetigena]|uniref:UvrD-helicase domain-containing protein n=1 Tax=Fuchsiella alkaliacetigena TaxID=957042 RepID=UPI00200B09EB|nr:UvrD-helicase domain-containing protein [Fuchsiella alkaliacetigena]MCK8825252.1 UvrD-helicase domain-containing protein [Fuchsiella alkaliacetigena]